MTEKRRLPRVRFAMRHPVKTLRRNHRKSIRHSGFGLLQLTIIGAFVVTVVSWLTVQYVSHVP
ncbi:hypothetical protein ACH492_39280 [Streptomyces sp. NPDC019443]|uniref:hypothetical protein n=1 Tax=Streptomyces sp. NPDC019443 TaxID=3365061 RepID=UPI0037BCEAD1